MKPQWKRVTLTTDIEKEFRDMAEDRVETLWKDGKRLGFEIPDLLMSAYIQGFTDCADVITERPRLERIMASLDAHEPD